MGGSSSCLKLKISENVVTLVYIDKDKFIKRTISSHDDNRFNKKITVTENYYNKYSGDEYNFDGDECTLNQILEEFDPKISNVKYLIDRLKIECDLERHVGFLSLIWNSICECGKFAINMPINTLNLVLGCSKILCIESKKNM